MQAIVCAGSVVGLLGCPPEEERLATSSPWLAVDGVNGRVFALAGGQLEAQSTLWAVGVDDGTMQPLLPETLSVSTGLTPDYLIASTAERTVVFERGSLTELRSLPGVVVEQTSTQANLAITRRHELLQLDTQRRLAALQPPFRATLAFTRAGGQLLVLSCPDDDWPVIRIRTFAVTELVATDDWATVAPERDFTLEVGHSVSFGAETRPVCTGPIHASPSGRYLATSLRDSEPLIIDLEAQSGRVSKPDGLLKWAFGFSPDERALLLLGVKAGGVRHVTQIDLPALTVAATEPLPGATWKGFVLVWTKCNDLSVYDTTTPERAPAVDPRSRCQPKDAVLWDLFYERGVDLTSGDPAPVPAIEASPAYYEPDLDRIVGLRDDPPTLLVATPDAANPAVRLFDLRVP